MQLYWQNKKWIASLDIYLHWEENIKVDMIGFVLTIRSQT